VHLTFLDYTTLEARGKSIEANLLEKDREIDGLKEKYDTDIALLKDMSKEFEAKMESKTQDLEHISNFEP
jgi:hypothetical protein